MHIVLKRRTIMALLQILTRLDLRALPHLVVSMQNNEPLEGVEFLNLD